MTQDRKRDVIPPRLNRVALPVQVVGDFKIFVPVFFFLGELGFSSALAINYPVWVTLSDFVGNGGGYYGVGVTVLHYF